MYLSKTKLKTILVGINKYKVKPQGSRTHPGMLVYTGVNVGMCYSIITLYDSYCAYATVPTISGTLNTAAYKARSLCEMFYSGTVATL